jgi:uncharacterized protein
VAQFRDLNIVLAHGGSATWGQALEIAETRGCQRPDREAARRLSKDIGPQRVMMGSDYPWYDLDHAVDRGVEPPILSAGEKAGIRGPNALNTLKL